MPTEAELRIRPRMVGDATATLGEARADMRKLGRVQKKEMRQGRRAVNRLESAYDNVRGGIGRMKRGLSGIANRVFSIQSAIVGAVAYGGGRTFLDLTIGSADDMARRRKQLDEIFTDANAAVDRSKKLTEEIASMSLGGAIKGMQSLGVKAGGSVEKAGELVKLGKALEQINPEQGFQGAVLAIKELTSGSTRSVVDRFNLSRSAFPDRDEAKRMAREQGKTMQQVFLGSLRDQIEKRGGVEKLLKIDRESLRGQMQMLETAGRDLLRTVGDEALPEVTESVGEAAKELRELSDDPEFEKAAKNFGEWMGDGAEAIADVAPTLIKEIPDAMDSVVGSVRSIKGFYDEHSGLIKTAIGLYVGNKALGGAAGLLTGRQGGLAHQLIKGGFSMSGGGGAGRAAGGLLGGGCCDGMSEAADTLGDVASSAKRGGSRSFLQKTLFSAGSSSAATGFAESTLASITPSLAVPFAAAAVPTVVGALGLKSFADAKRDPAETAEHAFSSSTETTNAIMNQLRQGNAGAAKRRIIGALGGAPNRTFTGEGGQSMLRNSVESRLSSLGFDLQLRKGQKFKDLRLTPNQDRSWMPFTHGRQSKEMLDQAERFNQASVQIQGDLKVDARGATDPEKVKEQVRQGVGEGLTEALDQDKLRR